MKRKEKVNEDDETEWEDCSHSEESSEDEDVDAELSNNEVNPYNAIDDILLTVLRWPKICRRS